MTHCQPPLDQPQHRLNEASAVVVEVRLVRRAPDRLKTYIHHSMNVTYRPWIERCPRDKATDCEPEATPRRYAKTSSWLLAAVVTKGNPTSSPNPTAHYEKATTGKSAGTPRYTCPKVP